MVRVPWGEVLGLACPGMASSHSRAFAVRGHHRARATLGFSTSPRCCRRRYKTASLKMLANSERASYRDEPAGFYGGPSYRRTSFVDFFFPSLISFPSSSLFFVFISSLSRRFRFPSFALLLANCTLIFAGRGLYCSQHWKWLVQRSG